MVSLFWRAHTPFEWKKLRPFLFHLFKTIKSRSSLTNLLFQGQFLLLVVTHNVYAIWKPPVCTFQVNNSIRLHPFEISIHFELVENKEIMNKKKIKNETNHTQQNIIFLFLVYLNMQCFYCDCMQYIKLSSHSGFCVWFAIESPRMGISNGRINSQLFALKFGF